MRICDSSYLIAFLHPNPESPKDRQGQPIARFKQRIEALIADLSAANDIIGVPTPALAEILVRSGPNRSQYMKVLGDTWKFQLLPFDTRAAIDAADLIAAIKTNKTKWDTWAKVKFDIQIVAIAKAEGATLIYSDDKDIENLAKRLNIRVMRICDLPLPPESKLEIQQGAATTGTQMFLIDTNSVSQTERQSESRSAISVAISTQPDDQLEASPVSGISVQQGNDGLAQGGAASEANKTVPETGDIRVCECGCGGHPKDPKSRFLPGHDLRKAYNAQRQAPPDP